MYQILCDGYPLLDYRDDDLIVVNPKAKVEVNTVGEASFTIYKKHPYYSMMKKMRSVFEVSDEIGVIFRGRMTNDSMDFDFGKVVDLEGAMAYFNDSIVRPFKFPEDFLGNAEYVSATENGNVVEFFLKWLIDNHNSQVEDFQKFKLGNVTVSDPNNYITRSSSEYANTWETIESKLFKSGIGGYLCIRYENDGNYIDYLSEFEYTNTQSIDFGENLLDLTVDSDATTTYSAIIPIGAEIEIVEETAADDGSGETEQTTIKKTITIEDLADGDITDDIVKNGDTLYSKNAVAKFGWICAPVKETTWEDVTQAENLLNKGVEYLNATAVKLSITTEFKAVDLHFTDEEIMSFRIYRNVKVKSEPHGINATYPLVKLEIDILNPQNTKITVGDTRQSLVDVNSQIQSDSLDRIEIVEKDVQETITGITEVKNQQLTLQTKVLNDCEQIILSALKSYVEKHVGIVVTDITNYYMSSNKSEGVTPETQGWDTSVPSLTSTERYLWSYSTTQYSNGTSTNTNPVIIAQHTGLSVSNIVSYYAANNDNENPVVVLEGTNTDLPWSEEIPTLSAEYYYLWHYKTITFTDGSTVDTEKVVVGSYEYSYSEFMGVTEAQMKILAGEIAMNFTTTTQQIEDVNGNLQERFEELNKYIRFTGETAITIGSANGGITLEIDNDKGIIFKKDDVQFGFWNGEQFITGNIYVRTNEQARFGNFAFVPREDGSLMFLKVGG